MERRYHALSVGSVTTSPSGRRAAALGATLKGETPVAAVPAYVVRSKAREELVELRLGGPDKLVLQVTELYNSGAHYEVHATL